MKSIVAIVGRPNVGKSTLFNRIIGQRLAIVDDFPGVTRDRLAAEAEWNGRRFTLVDTGGIEFQHGQEVLQDAAAEQARLAIREADAILWLVDGKHGLAPIDYELAELLRKSKKPVLLIVNKMESYRQQHLEYEFYRLGLGEPIPISAEHGINTGDMLDRLLEVLPPDEPSDEGDDDTSIRVAIVGRPNVGKSSLFNRLIGQQRAIVSDVAGTTRDAIDVRVEIDGQSFLFIDTAGMRRKSKVDSPVEYYSVLRTLRSIERAHVVLTLLDAAEKVTEQDKKIAGYAHNHGKASILVINKWDLIEKDDRTIREFEEQIRADLAFMNYAPMVFLSALSGQRVARLPEMIQQVDESHRLVIPTARLNSILNDALAEHEPPADRGRQLKIYYATQVNQRPPTFLFFCNDPKRVHYSYERYLENRLRQAHDFTGTPLRLVWKSRKESMS